MKKNRMSLKYVIAVGILGALSLASLGFGKGNPHTSGAVCASKYFPNCEQPCCDTYRSCFAACEAIPGCHGSALSTCEARCAGQAGCGGTACVPGTAVASCS